MNPSVAWSHYLSQGAPRVIYHMCDASVFEAATANGGVYFPPTYEADGFVHASAIPEDMVPCANNFYKNVKGDWICICLNPCMLDGDVKYELAAPVGNCPTSDTSGLPKFPHIYGGIPGKAVIRVYKMLRNNETGEFLSIQGL